MRKANWTRQNLTRTQNNNAHRQDNIRREHRITMLNDRTESGDKQSEQARIRREHIIQIVINKAAAEKNTEQKCT